MKHVCVIALVLVCVVPAFLWPTEELFRPLPASLAEEGFEVAGRQARAVRSTQSTAPTNVRKGANKSTTAEKRKGTSTAHHEANHGTAHSQSSKNVKKPKLNRPTKPGKKYERRHHQQKKHKNPTDSKTKHPEKTTAKPHSKNNKDKKPQL